MANGRCRVHGGATPAGIASVHWKTGRQSRYRHLLAADRQDDFDAALAAPDLLSLHEEIALVRTLASEALAPGPDLYALKRMARDMEKRLEALLNEEIHEEADIMVRGCLQLAQETYEALTGSNARTTDDKAFVGHVETLRKLVDTSARVMDIRANSFTRIQSMALISRVVELIAGNVKDPQDRRRLLTALTHLEVDVAPAKLVEKVKK